MSKNLTKRDIVLDIYEGTNIPQKDVRETVQRTLNAIAKALAEGRNVELRNFGVFEVQVRKSRIGRNPNKPETDVIIPTRAVIKFKAGKELKEQLSDLDLDAINAKES
jgi:nucleoid DNA-binding protein